MNEEALTPEELAIKWKHIKMYDGERSAIYLPDREFVSDLNALLRNELIKFLNKRDSTITLSVLGNTEAVDLYIKSQQQ